MFFFFNLIFLFFGGMTKENHLHENPMYRHPVCALRIDKGSLGKISVQAPYNIGFLARFLHGQSQCTWTCHKSLVMRKYMENGREHFRGKLFCASLRSQNAHGHVTRASSRGNLQGSGRTPMIPPRRNTGP